MIHQIHYKAGPEPLRFRKKSAKGSSKWPKPAAGIFTVAVLIVGYLLLGPLPASLFAAGYLGGLLLWLTVPTKAAYKEIRGPYFLTLLLFVAHKVEERYFGFFPALSEITGVSPSPDMILAKLLYGLAGAWLMIPVLLKANHPFGFYLAWTFFTSMGVTELAHFVFPFIAPGPLRYFPGLITATLLVPAGFWGLHRLWKPTASPKPA